MAEAWDEILGEATLDGVAFPLESRSISGGRDAAALVFPYQPGQDFEDTGRRAHVFKLRIPLYADVDESHYPELYERLLGICVDEDTKAEVEYQDPVLGPFRVKVLAFDIDETAMERNGATLQLTLGEQSLSVRTFTLEQRRSPAAEAEAAGEDLDDALEEQGVSDDEVSSAIDASGHPLSGDEKSATSGTRGASLARDFVEALSEGAQLADEIAARVDQVRARVDSILALPALRTPAGWAGYAAGLRLVDACSQLATDALSRAVPIVEHTVRGRVDVYTLAVQFYGDVSRAEELLAKNPQRNPLFIQPGTVLRVAAR